MIINAVIEGNWRYAETASEIEQLIADAVGDLREGTGLDGFMDDIDSRFMVADRRHTSALDLPHNFLLASVNRRTAMAD